MCTHANLLFSRYSSSIKKKIKRDIFSVALLNYKLIQAELSFRNGFRYLLISQITKTFQYIVCSLSNIIISLIYILLLLPLELANGTISDFGGLIDTN